MRSHCAFIAIALAMLLVCTTAAAQVTMTAERVQADGWMKGGWGSAKFTFKNDGETPAKIVAWTVQWEVNGEPFGEPAKDENAVALPPGEETVVSRIGWLNPAAVDEAKPDNPMWVGSYVVEIGDEQIEIPFRLEVPEAVLREKLIVVEGKHMGYALTESHFNLLEDKEQLLRWLDECYEAMQELTGYTPYGGAMMLVKESPPHPWWAYAGNPIVMDTTYVEGVIKEANAGIMPFGWIHELGHNFDIADDLHDDWYVWSGRMCEGMANFKLMYAYMAIPSRDWRAKWTFDKNGAFPAPPDGVLLEGKQFVDAAFLFEGDTYLPDHSRTYELDNTPSFMLRLAYVYGWDVYRKWFRTYKGLAELGHEPPETAEEKISLMAAVLSEAAGVDLVPVFQRWRYPVTPESVDAMKARYPVEEVVKGIVLPSAEAAKAE